MAGAQGLLHGKTLGIDATTLEVNAALRSILRRDDGRGYREFLVELAKAEGIEEPTREDLARLEITGDIYALSSFVLFRRNGNLFRRRRPRREPGPGGHLLQRGHLPEREPPALCDRCSPNCADDEMSPAAGT
ncbi:hypothetical protein [Nannocystis pusilla]|uniref:hypothetical protein n=1 Tax=Nannocystis pusilla TaxID=889268 RepID=UPI003B7A316C